MPFVVVTSTQEGFCGFGQCMGHHSNHEAIPSHVILCRTLNIWHFYGTTNHTFNLHPVASIWEMASCVVSDRRYFLWNGDKNKKKVENSTWALSKDVFVVYLSQHHQSSPTSLYLPQWKSDQWMYCRLPVSKNTLPLNSWSVGSCVLVANTSSVSWLTLVYCFDFRMLPLKLKAFSRCFVFPTCGSVAVLRICQGHFHRTWLNGDIICHMCSPADLQMWLQKLSCVK